MIADVFTESLRVIASLGREGVEYAVIGGVALSVHGLVTTCAETIRSSATVRRRGPSIST